MAMHSYEVGDNVQVVIDGTPRQGKIVAHRPGGNLLVEYKQDGGRHQVIRLASELKPLHSEKVTP